MSAGRPRLAEYDPALSAYRKTLLLSEVDQECCGVPVLLSLTHSGCPNGLT